MDVKKSTKGLKGMFSSMSMSQSPIFFIMEATKAQKNGEASSTSSDVVAYLDVEQMQVMQEDIKKQNKKRVPTFRIIDQYEKFFTRRMANCPAMVRATDARVEELQDNAIDDEYNVDWSKLQHVKPIKISKAKP